MALPDLAEQRRAAQAQLARIQGQGVGQPMQGPTPQVSVGGQSQQEPSPQIGSVAFPDTTKAIKDYMERPYAGSPGAEFRNLAVGAGKTVGNAVAETIGNIAQVPARFISDVVTGEPNSMEKRAEQAAGESQNQFAASVVGKVPGATITNVGGVDVPVVGGTGSGTGVPQKTGLAAAPTESRAPTITHVPDGLSDSERAREAALSQHREQWDQQQRLYGDRSGAVWDMADSLYRHLIHADDPQEAAAIASAMHAVMGGLPGIPSPNGVPGGGGGGGAGGLTAEQVLNQMRANQKDQREQADSVAEVVKGSQLPEGYHGVAQQFAKQYGLGPREMEEVLGVYNQMQGQNTSIFGKWGKTPSALSQLPVNPYAEMGYGSGQKTQGAVALMNDLARSLKQVQLQNQQLVKMAGAQR